MHLLCMLGVCTISWHDVLSHGMHVTQAGKTRLDAHLPALAHEYWFCWHMALWQGVGTQRQGLGRLGGATRTEAVTAVLGTGPAPIQAHRLRALQLRLAARHMRRHAHVHLLMHTHRP